MKSVFDTSTLLWFALDQKSLSLKALRACEDAEKDGALISSISIWEIGIKIKKKKLEIGITIEEFEKRLQRLEWLSIVPVDSDLWIKNLSLDWAHPDPADRCIVALSMREKLPLITKDDLIRKFYKKCIW